MDKHLVTIFDWNAFFSQGFLFQIDNDRIFVGHGPFKQVKIDKKNWFAHNDYPNGLLIKPKFWDFLIESDDQAIEALNPEASEIMTLKKFQSEFLKHTQASDRESSLSPKWTKPDQKEFQAQFDFLQGLMADNSLRKGVPIGLCSSDVAVSAPIKKLLHELITKLVATKPTSWAYGFWATINGTSEGYVGYTPEILFKYRPEDATLKMMALAGTWPKKKLNPNFSDPKIRDEHNIVIEDISNRIRHSKITDIKINRSETKVLELPDLYHLQTDLQAGPVQPSDLIDVALSLHPTAALGLYPRDPAIAKQLSNFQSQLARDTFGAPFILLHPQHCIALVSIRRVDWRQGQLHIWAGCGVVKESSFEAEFAEIEAKQRAVKKIFNLHETDL